jgi:hypothetical protein
MQKTQPGICFKNSGCVFILNFNYFLLTGAAPGAAGLAGRWGALAEASRWFP